MTPLGFIFTNLLPALNQLSNWESHRRRCTQLVAYISFKVRTRAVSERSRTSYLANAFAHVSLMKFTSNVIILMPSNRSSLKNLMYNHSHYRASDVSCILFNFSSLASSPHSNPDSPLPNYSRVCYNTKNANNNIWFASSIQYQIECKFTRVPGNLIFF